jgi:hypothetical protein
MSGDAPGPKDADRNTHGLVAVGLPIARITKPLFGRRGFIHGALVTEWPVIVGSVLAAHTVPMGIQFPRGERVGGQLTIKVSSSAFATQLQHLSPLVIDKVNGYFGWKAVDRLRLRHGPLPRLEQAPRPARAKPRTIQPPPALDQIEDDELRAALAKLAASLVAGKDPA